MKKSAKTSDEKTILEVTPRTIFGKKLKQLRREAIIPANIFGTGFTSKSISVPSSQFLKVYKKAKETGIVYLKLEDKEIPTLIKLIQKHPINSQVLHVDFRKVDLTVKIATEVPVHIMGVSEAVAQKGGVLLTLSERLSVEALPQNIPHHIEVDISLLKEIGQEIKVKDLLVSQKYSIKDDGEKTIVSITAHKEESVIAETAATATPEVITAKPEEGAEAGATPEPGTEKKPETDDKKEKEIKK
ncbi:50S ribosomal protein L25 [Candidatus Roizmanbacteria bacterium CG_4_10_14_0_8_um_filter_33_9]|uniref:Large ribosomal subunit protein bL25 n=1 Tax=Candidatus Roizmanbacteria bacterium CG_4_10_14_0_8_um_filter_33_9 TaxID=1974826 RepID=A0A2M7QIV1_9BACT|nr:MAG: 50S ribosomal protein L25 [Candidatus Roizmanbacteria bacterium CG_4_10_14_0_8_um_filter_33_9]